MRDALVVLGMGGPDSIEAIEPFLRNLFTDREIIDFHIGDTLQKFIAGKIAKKRSKKLAPSYLAMGLGGASPQNVYTDKLLAKVKPIYHSKTGVELDTYGAMCYYHPYIKDTIAELSSKSYRKIYLLPHYPHYSMTTIGATYSKLDKALKDNSLNGEVVRIHDWYKNEQYNECLTARIKQSADKLGVDVSQCHLLFSAHSIPISYLEKGDVYISQIEDHVKIICDKLGVDNCTLSYQSKVGPVKWVAPATDETLHKLADDGVDNIIVVPMSFISDHIETLIELDHELIPEIANKGINIVRSASLNDDDDFIESVISVMLAER